MQRFKKSPQRHEPLTNYRYSVHIYTSGENFIRLGFNHVTGLKTKIETERRKELGNIGGRNVPTGITLEDVVLSNGMGEDQQLIDYYTRQMKNGVITLKPFSKVVIRLHDRANNPRMAWTLHGCCVVGMDWSDLDGLSAEVLLQNTILQYDWFTFNDDYDYKGATRKGNIYI